MSQNKEVSRPLCQRVCWQCFKSFGPARPVVLSAWSKLSTARSLNVFRAFKSKDTSTDEDEGQNTKSKRLSLLVLFSKNQEELVEDFLPVVPPPPLPSPTFTETWLARAKLRLNTGNAGPSLFLLAEWNTTYDVFLGSKVSLIRAMSDSRKYGTFMMQLDRKMFPGKLGILMLMTDICRCLFVGKILIAQANN